MEELGPGARAALTPGALEGTQPSLSRTPAWGHNPPHLICKEGAMPGAWATPKRATPDPRKLERKR